MKKIFWLYEKEDSALVKDVGLLILRIVVGAFMMTHGWAKLMNFDMMAEQFPPMFGMSSKVAVSMLIFAEFFASIAIIFGFLTRLAAVPILFAMGVAGFLAHAADPFSVKELALLYFALYVVLIVAGAGRFSIDGLIRNYVRKKAE